MLNQDFVSIQALFYSIQYYENIVLVLKRNLNKKDVLCYFYSKALSIENWK